jgi:hypothetical protein
VSVLQSQQFADYPYMVACVHHTTKSHKPEKSVDPKTKKESEHCPLYPSIECSVHENMRCDSMKTNHTPSAIIMQPDGTIIFDVAEMDKCNALAPTIKKLDEAAQKVGKGVPKGVYDVVCHELDLAEKSLADEKYDKAIAAVKKAGGVKGVTQSMKDGRIKATMDKIEAKGAEIVEDAKSKHDGSPDDALKLVKKVEAQFKGCECAKTAAELEKEWAGEASKK